MWIRKEKIIKSDNNKVQKEKIILIVYTLDQIKHDFKHNGSIYLENVYYTLPLLTSCTV